MILYPKKTYLDHNATTPLATPVRKVMNKCLEKFHGNPASLHTAGRTARSFIENSRTQIADQLGCAPEKILFTGGGTEANNTVIKGIYQQKQTGHIITTKIEHESIIGATTQLSGHGIDITYINAGRDGRITPEDIRQAVRSDTILISVMYVNNETGVIQPVQEVAAIAEKHNIPFHVDAVQAFGKIDVKVDEIGCNFLSISAHKINGPKGCGALYWKGSYDFEPLIFGGSQEREMRAGTEACHQIAGFGAATLYSEKKRLKTYHNLKKLRVFMIDGIRKLCPDVIINQADEEYQLPGTVNVTFPGKEGLRLLAGLDCYGVAVSIGSACTADKIEPSHVLLGMGHNEEYALSTIRVSMGSTTSIHDIKYFLAVLEKVLEGDPEGFSYIDPKHITPERLTSDDTFVIDLRFPYERALAPSIPGAKLWSHIVFERYYKKIPHDKEIVLMCSTGIFSFTVGYYCHCQ